MSTPMQDKLKGYGKGLGTNHETPPISVKFSPKVDEYLRSLPNRSDFIRQAIIEKLEREGLYDL
jgi:hypothetical protein